MGVIVKYVYHIIGISLSLFLWNSIFAVDTQIDNIYLPALQKNDKILYLLNDTANPQQEMLVSIKSSDNNRIISKYNINNISKEHIRVTLTPVVRNKTVKEGLTSYHIEKNQNITVEFNLDPDVYQKRTDRIAKIECEIQDSKSKKFVVQDCIEAVLVIFNSSKILSIKN